MKIARIMTALAFGSALSLGTAVAAPGDTVQTSSKMVSQVHIQNASGAATYYFLADGGWQAANCPGVTHAYISESAPGAKSILAAVLAAKLAGTPITFTGICGDTAGNMAYLQIRYTVS